MSLINEALKKAQQDRAVGEALAAPTSYEQVNRSSSGPGFLKILIAAIFVASIFGGAVAFLVLGVMGRQGESADSPSTTISSAPAPQEIPKVDAPAPVAALTPEPKAVPPSTGPGASATGPTDQKPEIKKPILGQVSDVVARGNANMDRVDSILTSSKPPAPAPPPSGKPDLDALLGPATPPSAPAISQPPPAVTGPIVSTQPRRATRPPQRRPARAARTARSIPDPAILAYIDEIYIRGIRLAGKNSKVLMNNKVYRLNGTVSNEYGLRILEIRPQQIVFIDHAGFRYNKFF